MGRSVPMIYEHTAQKRHFVIEWARVADWNKDHPAKWVASCQGVVLARGSEPAAVLEALVKGDCLPMLDGVSPAAMGLPVQLDGWRKSRE